MTVDENAGAGNDAPPVTRLRRVATSSAAIDAWAFALPSDPAATDRILAWLSPAEHARRARFGTRELAARYVAGRATLRFLLGRKLALAPSQVPIVRGDRGRPRLEGIDGLDFNVTHTTGAGLIAIAELAEPRMRIGVDLERLDRVVAADKLARKFLTANERDAMSGLDADARRRRFLHLWTCKEAMSKATGDGLRAPFAKLEVDLGREPSLVAGPPPYSPAEWRLVSLDPGAPLVATLAIRTPAGAAR